MFASCFLPFIRKIDDNSNSNYGVSLTHGKNPHDHIWSFVGARDELSTSFSQSMCPCMMNRNTISSFSVFMVNFVMEFGQNGHFPTQNLP